MQHRTKYGHERTELLLLFTTERSCDGPRVEDSTNHCLRLFRNVFIGNT